jgi:hypothetical protein
MPDLTARRNTFTQRVRPVPGLFQARSRHIPIRADPSTTTTHDENSIFSSTVFCGSGGESHVMFLEGAWVQLALHILG